MGTKMAGINQLLPFANGETPNVIPYDDWNALAARLSGFQSGIASSKQFNYILAQGGAAGYVIGQLVADYTTETATIAATPLYQAFKQAMVSFVGDSPVVATGTTTPRNLADRFFDVVNVKDFGAKGDGETDDTDAIIAALDKSRFAYLPDGMYKVPFTSVEVVSKLALTRVIGTGQIVLNDVTINAADSPAIISSDSDTGPSGNPYSGGVAGTPTVAGRTTSSLVALIASQGCRSQGVRAVNVGSIYSWAYGNVSGNYSARQCVAGCPQSFNAASEECEVYGFQGANISGHFSDVEAGGGANLATRLSYTNGTNSVNIASTTCVAGIGHGARLSVTVSDEGVVTGVTVVEAGTGYSALNTVEFYDRQTQGSGAAATLSLGDSGEVLSVTVTSGGSGYSQKTDAVVASPAEYSANVATLKTQVAGTYSANVASRDSSVEEGSTCAGNFASIKSTVSGSRATTVASTGSHAAGDGALILSGNICDATNVGSVVFGRRTINDQARSIAFGDSPSGAASTANRKFHVFANGDVQAAGTITGSHIFDDYAEYFENLNAEEIPLGTLVALEGDKVRVAKDGDDILGAVSATAFVIGGDTPFTWAKRFKTGEFGERIYTKIPDPDWTPLIPDYRWTPSQGETEEDRPMIENPRDQELIDVPVENDEYDPNMPNIPRSQRKDEWSCVGILGQLHVRVDASVSVGSWIKASEGGIGTLSSEKTGMRCMKIKQAFDASNGYAVAICFLR